MNLILFKSIPMLCISFVGLLSINLISGNYRHEPESIFSPTPPTVQKYVNFHNYSTSNSSLNSDSLNDVQSYIDGSNEVIAALSNSNNLVVSTNIDNSQYKGPNFKYYNNSNTNAIATNARLSDLAFNNDVNKKGELAIATIQQGIIIGRQNNSGSGYNFNVIEDTNDVAFTHVCFLNYAENSDTSTTLIATTSTGEFAVCQEDSDSSEWNVNYYQIAGGDTPLFFLITNLSAIDSNPTSTLTITNNLVFSASYADEANPGVTDSALFSFDTTNLSEGSEDPDSPTDTEPGSVLETSSITYASPFDDVDTKAIVSLKFYVDVSSNIGYLLFVANGIRNDINYPISAVSEVGTDSNYSFSALNVLGDVSSVQNYLFNSLDIDSLGNITIGTNRNGIFHGTNSGTISDEAFYSYNQETTAVAPISSGISGVAALNDDQFIASSSSGLSVSSALSATLETNEVIYREIYDEDTESTTYGLSNLAINFNFNLAQLLNFNSNESDSSALFLYISIYSQSNADFPFAQYITSNGQAPAEALRLPNNYENTPTTVKADSALSHTLPNITNTESAGFAINDKLNIQIGLASDANDAPGSDNDEIQVLNPNSDTDSFEVASSLPSGNDSLPSLLSSSSINSNSFAFQDSKYYRINNFSLNFSNSISSLTANGSFLQVVVYNTNKYAADRLADIFYFYNGNPVNSDDLINTNSENRTTQVNVMQTNTVNLNQSQTNLNLLNLLPNSNFQIYCSLGTSQLNRTNLITSANNSNYYSIQFSSPNSAPVRNNSKTLSGGAIAGITIGSVFGLLAISSVVIIYFKRSKLKRFLVKKS